ncbi:MAG: hypothetical protein QXO67_05030 [Candidatus Bathyarchaeia archaeon]
MEWMPMRRVIYFWRDLEPLVRRFLRESGLPFNRFVNLAVQRFLVEGGCDVEELRLRARLALLLRREAELRRVQNCMLRSGAYLEDYVRKRLGQPVGPPKPLAALSGREAEVFKRIAGERERIANEIAGIMERLLKDAPFFKLDEDCSRVKKNEGGDKPNE